MVGMTGSDHMKEYQRKKYGRVPYESNKNPTRASHNKYPNDFFELAKKIWEEIDNFENN